MLEADTNELHSAKRALEEIASRRKKKKSQVLLLKQIITVS